MKRQARGVPARKGWRRAFVLAVVVLMSLVFSVRLVQIQVVDAEAYGEVSESKRAVPVTIPSLRGDIVDRNGIVLATTEERYDVQLSPKNTRVNDGVFHRPAGEGTIGTVAVTSEEAFAEIGEITGQTAEEISEIVEAALEIDEKSDFAYVKRSISLEDMKALRALRIPWLTFDYHFERTYPNGAVGGNLIGFAGLDEVPQAGVEMSQTECLTGADGYETYERGADGVALPGSHVVREQAIPGGTVELTIDLDLQWQAQQVINANVDQVGAEWGLLVLMDVKTGELIAVAEDGSVDPNDVSSSDPAKLNARSFVSPFEPGSTLKTVTMAMLLEEGVATPTSQYLTPYTFSPEPGVQFRDSFVHGEERWTLAGILTHSSNVGTAMMGTRLDTQTRYDYLLKFGLGQSTRAGLPLEDAGLLYAPEDWDRQTIYNITFGQGISSTIIQTAGIYQTIANGGVRVPPTLVRGCLEGDGTFVESDPGEDVTVVSKQTASAMVGMLETVATESYIKDYVSIDGYRIAGKTGTAEQPDGRGGYRTDYVHSFAGFFPADDPQYVAVAAIGFPSIPTMGGVAAGNSFREIVEATIRAYNIEPSSGSPATYPLNY